MGGISRLNNIYDNMKQRCYNPKRDVYMVVGVLKSVMNGITEKE